ncbi:hypothetical protein ELP85_10850, partial [Klebsiella pneumoniae]|nr:hypothetical protein [Klebsiella pneumoniae]
KSSAASDVYKRQIQDYISGMTDLYAWDEYRRLMAVE